MEDVKISWEDIVELIPQKLDLYYIDYRDDLEESLPKLQECIHEQSYAAINEVVWDCFAGCESYEYYDKELKSDMVRKFGIDEDEADDLFEEFREEIRDVMNDRDESDVLSKLLSNTSKQTMFFDTGYEIADGSWQWDDKQIKREVKAIKRVLGLKLKDSTFDEDLSMMVRQASYGGRLVVYFYDDVEKYFEIGENNLICFENACVAIIHTGNGSGDHCELIGSNIKLALDPKNIFICKTINYSYTFDVCGMYSNWCEGTNVSFLKAKTKKIAKDSSLNRELEREKELDKTYSLGKCTAGDMKYSRHRNVEYINNYPCGNKCKDCGTFWID